MQVRCLVDVPGDKLPSVATGALASYLRESIAPQVPEQLRGAFLAAIEEGRLRSMLNKQMTLTPLHRPGALLLGDAFNMRCGFICVIQPHLLCCSLCMEALISTCAADMQHAPDTTLMFGT